MEATMDVNLIRIGNSRGIRIPRKILDRCRVTDRLTLSVEGRKIILAPVDRKPREHWAEAAKDMHRCGDDELLIPDVFDDDLDLGW